MNTDETKEIKQILRETVSLLVQMSDEMFDVLQSHASQATGDSVVKIRLRAEAIRESAHTLAERAGQALLVH